MIDKIEINTYGDWQTIYVKADKETIAHIQQYVAKINDMNIENDKKLKQNKQ